MAYDEELAFRLRGALETVDGVTSKKMFGGMAFLLHGNMAIVASGKGGLMVRVDPAGSAAILEHPNASRMEMGGRKMNGWIRVQGGGFDTEDELQSWIDRGLAFARTLPPK